MSGSIYDMYKTNKKPDLLVILAVFVGLGVIISDQTLSVSNANDVSAKANSANVEAVDSNATVESPVQPSKTIKEVQQGDLLKVSYPLHSPLPTEI